MLSKLEIGTKKIGLMDSVVPLKKPRMEYCEDQNGTTLYIRAVQGRSHCAKINPTFIFSERDTVELERTVIPHGQLLQLSISLRALSMGRRIQFQKHEPSLFLVTSESARFVIATAE